MAVTRMIRLGLAVRSLDAMTRFYRDAFGCRLVADASGEAEPRRVSLGLGRQIIELSCFAPPGAPWPDDPRSNDLTFQHFAIAVADMGRAYAHLLTTGGWTAISSNGPVRLPASSGGVTAFKFRDPEGHPLELLEFPDQHPDAPLFYEINHSAIVIADTGRSLAFYQSALGLAPGKGSLNQGAGQAALDGLDAPLVQVTPLLPPGQETPHVELLCYQQPQGGRAAPQDKTSADAIATRMIFAAADPEETIRRALAAGGTMVLRSPQMALLRDPDGHDLEIGGFDDGHFDQAGSGGSAP